MKIYALIVFVLGLAQSFGVQVLFGPEVGVAYNHFETTDEQRSFVDPLGEEPSGFGYVSGLQIKWLMKGVVDVTLGAEVQKWEQVTSEKSLAFGQGSDPYQEYNLASKIQVWTITLPIKSHLYYCHQNHRVWAGIGFALGVPRYLANTWLIDGDEYDVETILRSQNINKNTQSNVVKYVSFFSSDIGYSFELKEEFRIFTRVEYKKSLNSIVNSGSMNSYNSLNGNIHLESLTLSLGGLVEFGSDYDGLIK
jgi:hypothetical protein